jgi:hypothetical protein
MSILFEAIAGLRVANERLKESGSKAMRVWPIEDQAKIEKWSWGDALNQATREGAVREGSAAFNEVLVRLDQLMQAVAQLAKKGREERIKAYLVGILRSRCLRGATRMSQAELDTMNQSGPFAGRCDLATEYKPIPDALIDALQREAADELATGWSKPMTRKQACNLLGMSYDYLRRFEKKHPGAVLVITRERCQFDLALFPELKS